MLHMGKDDLKESAFSAGSHSEPINENGDVWNPASFCSFGVQLSVGNRHLLPLATCLSCQCMQGLFSELWSMLLSFYVLYLKKPKQRKHQTQGCFPLLHTPYIWIGSLSINLRMLWGLAAHLGTLKLHLPGPGGVPNGAGCLGGWSWGGSHAAKALWVGWEECRSPGARRRMTPGLALLAGRGNFWTPLPASRLVCAF